MIEKLFARPFTLWRFSIAALALLSLASFAITAWLLADFRHEQAIVEKITEHLPASDLPQARQLAQELRLQSRLSLLLVVNLLGSAFASVLLVRAYYASERQLRRARVQAEDILASLDQGVITADQQGWLINVNPKGKELLEDVPLGIPFALPIKLSDLPAPHISLNEMREELLLCGAAAERQYCVEHAQHLKYLRAGCSTLRDHDEEPTGVVIHLQDVTEKNLMQQRLMRMERYMGLGSLAAGLQHEIKNPLSALALHVQLLQESLGEQHADEAVGDSLHVLATEVQRIARVLESFRDFASLRELERVPTDMRMLLKRIVDLTGVEAKEKGIELVMQCEEGIDLTAEVDATRMEQVVLNLMVNAFDAMPHGGQLGIDLNRHDNTLVLNISDNGAGIPSALQDRVFDLYFTTKATGTGMGLALCDKIIRQHEGTLDFVSSPQGTKFTIQLASETPHEHESRV